ncbi:tail fiber domain-containing protein [Ulvibacter litoralis]|uniref:Chaperone of endosialidase n=1 Tax=Ulvibacter litoralis TaxID=227084 RepID=A0A1G7J9N5_9FLAO|nr:tail fiber domain-containing protein [Ulvibacter litoralis]GHC64654.1 hypothetical protein GCM10008083_32380 [Ulvibacter litoralis]SDF21640.1 Chaperone of endosialidase [Ulvibacter litoralis]
MKNLYLFIVALFISATSIAQNGINYKALIKDANGDVIANQSITIQFQILKGGATNVYQEKHTIVSEDNGTITAKIGEGIIDSGDFSVIDWGDEDHYLNIKVDIGDGYVDLGNTQFKSVPYALVAANVHGLEKLDEGNGVGYRLKDKLAGYYGDIGLNAIDVSYSNTSSTDHGATGSRSFTAGYNTVASGLASTAVGFENEATASSATALGYRTKSDAVGNVAVGTYNIGGGSPTSFNSANPIFEVGNGLSSGARSNALTVLQNGKIGIGKHTGMDGIVEINGNSTGNEPQLALIEDNAGYSRLRYKNTNRNGDDYWDIAGFIGETTANDKLNIFNSDAGDILTATGDGKVGIGISNPTEALDIDGNIKADGIQLNTGANSGYVLTSDADGTASWQAPTGGGGSSANWIENGNNVYTAPNIFVGIGTTDPTSKLHVVANTRIEGDLWGSSTSEVTPAIRGQSVNMTGVRGASTNGYGIEGLGHIGGNFIGYTGNGINVDANSENSQAVYARSWGENGIGVWGISVATTGAGIGVRGSTSSPDGFSFFANGVGISYGEASSRRWKSNIVEIDNALEKLSKIRGVYYDLDEAHGGKHDVGMIAEEVGAVLPEIVTYEENKVDAIGMDYSKMTPLLVQVAKEQQKVIEAERAIVAQLKQQLQVMTTKYETLDTRLSALEMGANYSANTTVNKISEEKK